MDTSEFLYSVATEGFTRACATHGLNRPQLKIMCDHLSKDNLYKITPFSTKQQIVYFYLSSICK